MTRSPPKDKVHRQPRLAVECQEGDLDAAGPLCREALEVRRETLGSRHPSTLASINDLGSLLKTKGDLLTVMGDLAAAESETLLREVRSGRRRGNNQGHTGCDSVRVGVGMRARKRHVHTRGHFLPR